MSEQLKNRIEAMGLVLPPAPKPAGVYKPILIIDNQLYVSGQGPVLNDGGLIQGKVGSVLNKEEAKHAARQVGLTMLSSIVTHAPPNLKIKRVIKVLGMVNATPEFGDHPYVINGFSELMETVFGTENGIGVRSAVGMSLPQNIAVEIEALFLLTS
ncbi:MAG: RidA family protein [Flavobacteriaceae bacterium]|nr:RidA family protein [Flavobacteriaceae bacterium]